MRRALFFLACLLFSIPASALWFGGNAPPFATLYNFANDATVPDFTTRITERDTAGNAMDAHSGNIMQDGGFFYEYGEHHGGGYRYLTAGSPAPGFNVYRSTDLVNWTRRGYIIDPASSWSVTNCVPSSGTNNCFRPHMLKNAANNNYVLFAYQFTPGAGVGKVWVTTCTAPDDGSTCGTPTAVTLGHVPADFTVFVDPSNNNGYIVYSVTTLGPIDRDVFIEALDSAYTIPQGSPVTVCSHPCGEAPLAFVRNGLTYVGYGSLCGYCVSGSTTLYRTASTPLGVYGSATQIDTTNSCHSQSASNVNVITVGGYTTYLYSGDEWDGQQNQGWANKFVYPLSFTGNAIDAIPCPLSVNIPGLSASTYPTPNNYPAHVVDQSDVATRGAFNDLCFVNATTWSLQTFVPTSSNLYGVGLALGKGANVSQDSAPAGNEPATDGNLVVDIVIVDGSNNPTGSLGSVSIAASTLSWVSQFQTLVFNLSGLTPGGHYGIQIKGSGTTQGCFTTAYSRFSNAPYAAGVHKFSTNSGSTWTLFPAYALMFQTYSAP